ncbi:MAG TPA: tetratricopeptide repeat protein [Pirellulaceae bacterium]|jgi:TolA-binding protein|nr:tetratricopeptide repeat protein [Pirellulaceae bacterium]
MLRRFSCSLGTVGLAASLGLVSFHGVVTAQPGPPAQPAGQAPAAAKLNEKSSPEGLAAFSRAAEFQNGGAFDLATEEWKKFLKNHPQDPLVPKATYYLAVSQISQNQLEEARKNLQALTTTYPKADLREDALLNLGWLEFSLAKTSAQPDAKATLFAEAAATLTRQLQEFPADKATKRDQALYFLAESLYLSGKKNEAVPYYRELVEKFPDSNLSADAAYALGVALEETKAYAEAEKVYATFLAKRPDHELAPEVTMRRGEALLQLGLAAQASDPEQAKKQIAEADELFAAAAAKPDYPSADYALFRQALAKASLGQFAEAGALYASVAEKYPQSPYAADAQLAAGQMFYRAENFDAAQKAFDAVLAAGGSGKAEAAHWNARILIRQNKFAEAASLAEKTLADSALGDSPFAASLALDRADALYEIPEQRAAAHDAYLAFVEKNPQHADAAQALYNAAFASFELKEYDRAEAEAKRFVQTFANHALVADVREIAAESQLLRGQYAAAAESFEKLTTDFADHAKTTAWQLRGATALYFDKKYDEALAAAQELTPELEEAGQKSEAQFLVGASQFHLKNYDAALKSLQASLAADAARPNSDEARLLLARTHLAKNAPAEALKELDAFFKAYPKSPLADQAHYRQGEAQTAAKAWDAAREAYGTVIEDYPQSPFVPFALYGAGWADLQAKRFGEATASFAALLKDRPDSTLTLDATLAKASAERQAGNPEAALDDLEAAMKSELPPQRQAQALHEKGLALQALNKPAEAAEAFAAALTAMPDYAAADAALYERAWALKAIPEQAEQSVAVFAELAEKHPDSPLAPEARFHVAEAKYAAKEFAAAAEGYAAALEGAKANELIEKATYKLGWSQYQAQNFAEAAASFASLAEKFPSGGFALDALFMLGESRFKLKEYEPALAAFRQAEEKVTPETDPKLTTLLYLHAGQAANQLKQYKEALELLANVTEERPNDEAAPQAFFETGRAQQGLSNLDQALAAYRVAAEKSRGVVGAEAQFLVGELLFAQKKHEEAFDEFRRALFGYGGESAPAEVKVWHAKAAYEAARVRDVQASDAQGQTKQTLLADALKYYRMVEEKYPDDSLAAAAKKRANEIANSIGS